MKQVIKGALFSRKGAKIIRRKVVLFFLRAFAPYDPLRENYLHGSLLQYWLYNFS
jgi:hypothetical protein